ncbi:SDR family NAD(P)-dependent oxidoreductase [Paraburkholderia rhizosphaerae]|uniref:Short-subunit dehydrogenase n=1 Tax=Paraburkholderia rhizosphaerae TaxID=480658 RepID=A0A4R8LD00_9BURK|nr:SDR family NAD(P)-dependent oxidoreductase [Paraburkholderia rhizosphaerae]TDY40435.1 short-subunit dehydrogenase [Paraburkholderia rhizosphaerae]
MNLKNTVALVTGAAGGIGREFVLELLERGASKVYAGGRQAAALAGAFRGDPRIVPLVLDVTYPAHVAAAAVAAPDVSLVINNAGYCAEQGALAAPDLSAARTEIEVNYFGPLLMARAFAPVLARNGGGAIVNVLSILSLATLPMMGTYSAAKAAGLSLTRSIGAELAAQRTLVVASMPTVTDTAMGGWAVDMPKVAPRDAASETLDAVEAGETEVFPGHLSREAAAAFAADPKAFQARLATVLPRTA